MNADLLFTDSRISLSGSLTLPGVYPMIFSAALYDESNRAGAELSASMGRRSCYYSCELSMANENTYQLVLRDKSRLWKQQDRSIVASLIRLPKGWQLEITAEDSMDQVDPFYAGFTYLNTDKGCSLDIRGGGQTLSLALEQTGSSMFSLSAMLRADNDPDTALLDGMAVLTFGESQVRLAGSLTSVYGPQCDLDLNLLLGQTIPEPEWPARTDSVDVLSMLGIYY